MKLPPANLFQRCGRAAYHTNTYVLGVNTRLVKSEQAPHPNAARLFSDFALSKEGQEMVRNGLREPARGDVESPSSGSLKGFKRVVISPENYQDYKEYVRLYQEIFRTR